MKSNLTLIGMPGSGKSTVGIILAKLLTLGFLDTDVLIQINRQKSLQEIMNGFGYLGLRKIEEEEILKINVEHHVIATGGSSVYSDRAMAHLREISHILFLKVAFGEIQKRIHNFETRGIAKAESQTFGDVFRERQDLYHKHAEITIDCGRLDQDEVAEMIASEFRMLKAPPQ